MFVGVSKIELHIPYVHSLKEKRRVIKKVLDNLRNRYPVSVAEVDDNDLWQKAVLGVSLVSGDRVVIDRIFQGVSDLIDEMNVCEVISFEKEIFSW